MRKTAVIRENIRISFQSILTNKIRSILTIFIIAFGIMALVGILTAISSINHTVATQFAYMGANTVTISSRSLFFHGDEHSRVKNYSYISYQEAERFKEEFKFPAKVSVFARASGIATVKFQSKKTHPNIPVFGTDENYLSTSGYEIDKGRNFMLQEIEMNRNYAIIGSQLSNKLFGKEIDPLDKIITVGSGKYRVIGVLKEKGTSFGGTGDQIVLLPFTNVRQYFPRPKMNFSISIVSDDAKLVDASMSEAEGLFRIIRGLSVTDKSDFEITKSDTVAKMFQENTKYIALAATIIGLITLFGAAIGLMNIMLVSVTERTSEIGIRKAIGATSRVIKQQFLYEAVIIGQLGGLVGIFLGILAGNIVSLSMKSSFVVPWIWILFGVVICFIVGIISGYLPATKAAKVDPIISLHYE